MKVFVIPNRTPFAQKRILGLTPTDRLFYQINAAGIGNAAVTDLDGDVAGITSNMAAQAGVPVAVFDSSAIFQRDFAGYALSKSQSTNFTVTGRLVAAVRFPDTEIIIEAIDGRAVYANDKAGVKAAKDMLIKGLLKPMLIDGIVGYYVMRPVTTRITRLIANTPITPNQVTGFCMFLGLLGAALVGFGGSKLLMILGVFLYFVGATLDCVDGELARLKYAGSLKGAWFDTISDDVSTAAMLVAMGMYVSAQSRSHWWLCLGSTAAALFMIGEFYLYYYLATLYHSGDVLDFQWASGMKKKASSEGLADYLPLVAKRDFFSLLLVVFSLAGIIGAGLVYLSVGMIGFFVFVVVDVVLSCRKPGWRTSSSH